MTTYTKKARNFNGTSGVKYLDTQISYTTIGPATNVNTGVIVLNNSPNGTNTVSHEGNTLIPQSLGIKISTGPAGFSNNPGPYFRCALVYDSTAGTVISQGVPIQNIPTYETIFQGVQANGTTFSNGNVGVNPSYTQRFQVLADENDILGFIQNSNGITIATTGAQRQINRYVKLRSFKVQFGTGAQQNLISTGAFYLVLWNSQPSGTLSFQGSIRFAFFEQKSSS